MQCLLLMEDISQWGVCQIRMYDFGLIMVQPHLRFLFVCLFYGWCAGRVSCCGRCRAVYFAMAPGHRDESFTMSCVGRHACLLLRYSRHARLLCHSVSMHGLGASCGIDQDGWGGDWMGGVCWCLLEEAFGGISTALPDGIRGRKKFIGGRVVWWHNGSGAMQGGSP